MTWLKGSSTWADICSDLTKLACGEMADGASVTIDSADQWTRQVVAQDYIQSPVSEDIALPNMSNRTGYFALGSYISGVANTSHQQTWVQSVCKNTGLWSGVPTGVTANRWILIITITTANAVAGTYSDLRYSASIIDIDTGTLLTTTTGNTVAAGGTASLSILTKTLALTFSDPSGIITNATKWWRSFTSVYTGGFDYMGPLFSRRRSAPTFSVALPGVAATDYDITEITTPIVAVGSLPTGVPAGNNGLTGIGWKTATFLTGALYTCTWDLVFQTARMIAASGGSNGQITLEWMGGLASDAGTYRRCGGLSLATWLRPYQTPASVTSGSIIEYWMSVKPNKIVVILNADPSQSGKLTCAMIGTFDPVVPTVDINPAFITNTPLDYNTDQQSYQGSLPFTQTGLFGWMLRSDGSEVRDWQTGYIRDAEFGAASSGSDTFGEAQLARMSSGVSLQLPNIIVQSTNAAGGTIAPLHHPANQFKPAYVDDMWWLYGISLVESMNISVSAEYPRESYVRGYLDGPDSPIFWIPGGQWTSGSELTDTLTAKKYFLVAADHHGILWRFRYNANQYTGGVAVLEE